MSYEEDHFDRFMERYIGQYIDRIDEFYKAELEINSSVLALLTYMVIFIITPATIIWAASNVFSTGVIAIFFAGMFAGWFFKLVVTSVRFFFALFKSISKLPKYLAGKKGD